MSLFRFPAGEAVREPLFPREWAGEAAPPHQRLPPPILLCGRLTLNILLSFAHYAECGIMRSYVAEVTVWLAFQ
jgi:hypothetical protein